MLKILICVEEFPCCKLFYNFNFLYAFYLSQDLSKFDKDVNS